METGLIHILLILLAYLLNLLVKYQNRTDKTKFNIQYWFKDNWLSMAITLVSIIILYIIKDELIMWVKPLIPENLYTTIDNSTKILCVIIGYMGSHILRKILNKSKSEIDKKLSI